MNALQSVSFALAREMNPETVAAQQKEIAELRRRNAIVENLVRRDREWQVAAMSWLFADSEELVVNSSTGPETLWTLIENRRSSDASEAIQSVLDGQLPRYRCTVCLESFCPGHAGNNEVDRMPARVRRALASVIGARKAAHS